MPEIELPESVASTDPDLSSSAPFGSLRESQFTHPHLDRWQQHRSNCSSIHQQTTTQFQPQSLPAYAATGSGGIGSFFPELNNNTTSERDASNESSGIGGLLEGSGEGDIHNNYSRDVAGITNQYSQLTFDGSSRHYAVGQGNVSFDSGRPNHTTNDGHLSSSLTALDLLARIRQTTPIVPTSQIDEQLEPNADPPTGLMESSTPLHHQLLLPQHHNEARSHGGGNLEQQYDHHADPDMFEAFDFELDE